MNPEERKEFEENRAELIDSAWVGYQVRLKITPDDSLIIEGDLDQVVEFYQNYRSEIEEML